MHSCFYLQRDGQWRDEALCYASCALAAAATVRAGLRTVGTHWRARATALDSKRTGWAGQTCVHVGQASKPNETEPKMATHICLPTTEKPAV